MGANYTLPRIPRGATLEQATNIYNQVIDELEHRLSFLQSVNIQEVGGWKVGPTELKSKDGDVGMSTAADGADSKRLWAGGADKEAAPWYVTQSGKMHATGATLESNTGYPKIVMDPTGKLFAAYTDEDTYVGVTPDYLGNGPGFIAVNGDTTGGVYSVGQDLRLNAAQGLKIVAGLNIEFESDGDTGIGFPSWVRIYNVATGQSLQAALNTKATKGISTEGSGSHNHGIGDGVKLATTTDGATVSGYVTFFGVSNHTHSQN